MLLIYQIKELFVFFFNFSLPSENIFKLSAIVITNKMPSDAASARVITLIQQKVTDIIDKKEFTNTLNICMQPKFAITLMFTCKGIKFQPKLYYL